MCITIGFHASILASEGDIFTSSSDTDKEKIMTALYVRDRFCVSEEAYHELTQIPGSTLQKTYLVSEDGKSIDRQWVIRRTPGEATGAEISFQFLLEREIRKYVSTLKQYRIALLGFTSRMTVRLTYAFKSFAAELVRITGNNYMRA